MRKAWLFFAAVGFDDPLVGTKAMHGSYIKSAVRRLCDLLGCRALMRTQRNEGGTLFF